ncbi:MAG TPA: OsmC family protein [Bacteroidia bacterium]|nr:OsmC family protein [Bacteroidia bacterium]
MKIELKHLDDAFHFEAANETGNIVHMDSSSESGKNPKGVGPMQMLLMALGGCSGIDVVMILKKQKQEITDFKISIDADRENIKDYSFWKNIHIHFKLKGNIELGKAKRAADLSIEKYCSVAKTLEKTSKITYSVSVNE